jgi:hypothetical protein
MRPALSLATLALGIATFACSPNPETPSVDVPRAALFANRANRDALAQWSRFVARLERQGLAEAAKPAGEADARSPCSQGAAASEPLPLASPERPAAMLAPRDGCSRCHAPRVTSKPSRSTARLARDFTARWR